MRPDEAIARLTGWEEIFLEEGDEDEKAHADDLRAVLDYIGELEQERDDARLEIAATRTVLLPSSRLDELLEVAGKRASLPGMAKMLLADLDAECERAESLQTRIDALEQAAREVLALRLLLAKAAPLEDVAVDEIQALRALLRDSEP